MCLLRLLIINCNIYGKFTAHYRQIVLNYLTISLKEYYTVFSTENLRNALEKDLIKMILNSEVKSLFYLEIREKKSSFDFDKTYYAFEQLIEMDIDVPAVEGLRERLPYALNKIAIDKLNRNDIITYFPIVWGKYEVFVKKLLYIIDRVEYKKLHKAKSGLSSYMEALGVPPYVDRSERTKETKAIRDVYDLRNTEAHACEFWSLKDFYYKLSQTLSAYLITVNKVLPDLQKVMDTAGNSFKLDLNYQKQVLKYENFNERFFRYFFRIADINSPLKSVTIKSNSSVRKCSFAEDGKVTDEDDPKFTRKYDCNQETGLIDKCQIYYRLDDIDGNKADDYETYEYYESGQVKSVTRYYLNKRVDEYEKRGAVFVEYLSDGGLKIKHVRYRRENQSNPLTKNFKDEQEYLETITAIKTFNNQGLLTTISDDSGNTKQRYFYTENGIINRIESSDGTITEVKAVLDTLLYYRKSPLDDNSTLEQKITFCNSRITKINMYPSEHEIVFEYYE